MGRYVPKTYNNRRWLRIIFRAAVLILLAVLIMFVVLFFGLRYYFVPGEGGTGSLDVPWLTQE